MKKTPILAALLLFAVPAAAQAQHAHHQPPQHGAQPYAELAGRDIRALSPQQVDDLRQGRGMALALPAELNGWPGPAHVLEHAEALHLSPDQRRATAALMEAHRARAMALGEQVIVAERAMDRAFRDRSITPASLEAHTTRIATLQAALRAEHLRTHLEQTALLHPPQVARYDVLRGYAAPGAGGHRH